MGFRTTDDASLDDAEAVRWLRWARIRLMPTATEEPPMLAAARAELGMLIVAAERDGVPLARQVAEARLLLAERGYLELIDTTYAGLRRNEAQIRAGIRNYETTEA
jgi:hypothetical protein